MDHFRHQIPLLYSKTLLEMDKQMIGFALPGVIGPLAEAGGSSMAAADGIDFVAPEVGPPVAVPDGWTVGVADSGKGILISDPASGSSIRIMDPVTKGRYIYENGYVRYTNGVGEYIDPTTGLRGTRGGSHVPLPVPVPPVGFPR